MSVCSKYIQFDGKWISILGQIARTKSILEYQYQIKNPISVNACDQRKQYAESVKYRLLITYK